MHKVFHPLNDGGSVVYALLILIFFNLFPGFSPGDTGTEQTLGYLIAAVIAFIYYRLEIETVNREATPSWQEIPRETFFSYLPLMAFVSVATRWFDGLITFSFFQLFVALIWLAPVLHDLFRNLGMIAQRLFYIDPTSLSK